MKNNYDFQHNPDSVNYPYKNMHPKRRKPKFPFGILVCSLIIITLIFVLLWVILGRNESNITDTADTSHTYVTQYETVFSEQTDIINESRNFEDISLFVSGDAMYHSPQLDAAYNYETDTYDFSDTYMYLKNVCSRYDYSVVNFESTLPGPDIGFSGYPLFHTPDSGFTILKETGYDMFLFANNHSYDSKLQGIIRTQEVFRDNGVDWIGASLQQGGSTYYLADIKGIKIGMLNSTDDISYGNLEPRTINGIVIDDGALDYIDVFNHSLLEEFYAKVSREINDLKTSGADIIIYFIHWGDEYYLTHNDIQAQIARKLCDMGVDLIIGSHPHVVQDAEILTSSADPSHTAICFYSLGNLVSNQNRATMGDTMNSAYTENGLSLIINISKESNGNAYVSSVNPEPTWVHRYNDYQTGKLMHVIVPLNEALNQPSSYGLDENSLYWAQQSYDMTMNTLGSIFDSINRK